MVKLLLKHSDPEAVNAEEGFFYFDTPLSIAIQRDPVEKEVIQAFLDGGAHVNQVGGYARDCSRPTPLAQATENGLVEIARLLLDYGADVNRGDKYGGTPLHYVASKIKSIDGELLQLLIEHGLIVDRANGAGKTALHYAAEDGGSKDVITTLIQNGAKVNAVDNNGRTPFCLAAKAEKDTAVELMAHLVSYGADTGVVNKFGDTPLSEVCRCPDQSLAEKVKFMVDNGLKMNILTRNQDGKLSLLEILKDTYEYDYFGKFDDQIREVAKEFFKATGDVSFLEDFGLSFTVSSNALRLREGAGKSKRKIGVLSFTYDPLKVKIKKTLVVDWG